MNNIQNAFKTNKVHDWDYVTCETVHYSITVFAIKWHSLNDVSCKLLDAEIIVTL